MHNKLNCKAGDLAIVVSTELPENLGQIVEVLGLQTGTPVELTGLGHVWRVRALGGRRTLFYRFNNDGRIVQHAEGPAPDRCLRPISGLLDDVAARVSQDVPCRKQRAARRRLLPEPV